jgi:hypothetical protein
MKNDDIMTLNLRRLNVCDLQLALTGLIGDMKREMNSDPECPEYRKTVVLPASIKKWKKLKAEISKQFEEQDAE